MRFTEKDLDALLWEWAAMTLAEHDSGYPSSYIIEQRIDNGVIYVPDYYPHPKICCLASEIFSLEADRRNAIVAKYLFNMKPPEIAKATGKGTSTIYRYLQEAFDILLDKMRNFVYKSCRL